MSSRVEELVKKVNRPRLIFSAVFGLFFCVLFICGYQLQNNGLTSPGVLGKLSILGVAILFDILVAPLLYLVISFADKNAHIEPINVSFKSQLIMFMIFFAVTFICWVPAFLAYYPCVMSSDFDIQLYQVKQGHEFFTNHHPYLSTLEIEFFYNLSPILGTVRKAMAALGIWHLMVMSSAFAMLDLTIYKLCGKKWIAIVMGVLFILYPVNPVLGLSTTKDVDFSAAFLWFMCLLADKFFIRKSKKLFEASDIALWLMGLIMCSFRNNAVYALAVTGIIMVIVSAKKNKLWYAVMLVAILFSFKLSQFGIERALGVSSSSATPEMHSVIIQTLGRTYVNNENELPKEVKDKIEYYIPKDELHKYNPALSDPLKTPVTNETFKEHWVGNMGNVIRDWVAIGMKYPDDYIDAFLDLTRGYWSLIDRSYAEVWGSGLVYRMGLLYTNNTSGYYDMEEIWHESKMPQLELVYEKILSRNDFFKWPVINLLFRLSFYVWIFAFMFFYFVYKKSWNKALLGLFPLIYFCTLLLGPTAYIRYIFPIMAVVPVYTFLLFSKSAISR